MNDINDMNDISMNFEIECFCVFYKKKKRKKKERKRTKKQILVLMSRLFLGV